MSDSEPNDLPEGRNPDDDCPLPAATQSHNILCFAGLWSCFYLVAPVSYVGVTHATFLKDLGSSDTVANLPHAFFQWGSALPILFAWFFPQVRLLKPMLVISLVAKAIIAAMVAIAIWLRLPAEWVIASVILFGAVFGCANGVMIITLWELLRRGVSTARRGRALGLTFGIGPLFACVGSVVQQIVTDDRASSAAKPLFAFPNDFLVIFAAACPILLLSAWIAARFTIPLPLHEPRGERWPEIVAGLREFLGYRPVVLAVIAYMLVYSGGNAIIDTVSIHAKDMLKEMGTETVGYQNLLRFGSKAATGMLLGWVLAKTNPKVPLLVTTLVLVFALIWVLNVSGRWYLLSFAWLGAGELFGAYFPNYVTTGSSKGRVRTNMAYLNLTASLVGVASIMFGVISDRYGRIATFQTATGLLLLATVLIVGFLPSRPVPREP